MKKYILFGIVVLIGALGLTLFQKSSQPPSTTPNKTEEQPLPTSSNQATKSASSDTIDDVDTKQTAIIKTEKGDIALTLYQNDAPKTVANFIEKAKSGFYNNLTFHRVEDWVIQGGDPLGKGTGGEDMPTELNNKPFVVGSLGVARGPDVKVSNDAQFFITKKDSGFLNGQYTNFGIVTNGMDVVRKIEIRDKILEVAIE